MMGGCATRGLRTRAGAKNRQGVPDLGLNTAPVVGGTDTMRSTFDAEVLLALGPRLLAIANLMKLPD